MFLKINNVFNQNNFQNMFRWRLINAKSGLKIWDIIFYLSKEIWCVVSINFKLTPPQLTRVNKDKSIEDICVELILKCYHNK